MNHLRSAEPDVVPRAVPAANKGSLFYSVAILALKRGPLVP